MYQQGPIASFLKQQTAWRGPGKRETSCYATAASDKQCSV